MSQGRAIMALFTMMLVFAGGLFLASGEARAGGCPAVGTFAVGGNGDPLSSHVPGVGGGWVHRVRYPADVWQGGRSRQVAMANLNQAARSFRHACPGSHISVVGYSLGASGASRAVDLWQGEPWMSSNTSAMFYGNPRRPGGAYGGIETAGVPSIPNYTMWGPHQWGPIPIREICNWRDLICNTSRPWSADLTHNWDALLGYAVGTDHLY